MAEHPPLDELIEHWLDGTTSESERCQLEEGLRDPQQRERFVAACRLHTSLESLLQEEASVGTAEAVLQTIAPAPRPTRRPATLRWAAAAALLLTAAAILWSALGRLPPASTPQASASATAHRPASEINVARVDAISTQEAMFFFGLVTSNAIK
jgi:ferric-dicitrate binding protein FerR (iron transport regulator)